MKGALPFLALFFMLLPQLGNGQSVNKGSMYIGAIGGFDNSEYGFSGFLLPRFEYLVGDKFSIGSELGLHYNYIKFHEIHKSGTVVISPFARYYFLNKKISPIAEVNYIHGFKFDNHDNSFYKEFDTNSVYLNVGISTPRLILNRVGFDLTTGLVWDIYPRGSRFRYAPLTSFRITYCIKRK